MLQAAAEFPANKLLKVFSKIFGFRVKITLTFPCFCLVSLTSTFAFLEFNTTFFGLLSPGTLFNGFVGVVRTDSDQAVVCLFFRDVGHNSKEWKSICFSGYFCCLNECWFLVSSHWLEFQVSSHFQTFGCNRTFIEMLFKPISQCFSKWSISTPRGQLAHPRGR